MRIRSHRSDMSIALVPSLTVIAAVISLALCPVISALEDGEEGTGATPADAEQVKIVKMVAENWKFTPDLIRVKKGTTVVVEVQSFGAPHSFVLKAFKIKVPLPQKKKTTFEFVANKVGEFTWRCGRPCGDGCAKMTGTLIVVE